ncbi:MAG: cytochrome C oxidase subunit I, partial [Gammaproteobacteria bacterium]|nr:cytochrome C oxidase subunit I [Gammaproteobacteria bacterium]
MSDLHDNTITPYSGETFHRFALPIPDSDARRLTAGWLLLGLAALLIGGLLTVLIVLSRTPFFQGIIPWTDFFLTAIVVHVDMTVLVWFLAFAGVFWSYNNSNRCPPCGWIALALASVGTLIMAVSPFSGESYPLMNNYVPVLQSTTFFTGLTVFSIGFGFLVLRTLFSSWLPWNRITGEVALRFGLFVAVVGACFAILAFALSYLGIDEGFEGQAYYDRLFWGSGHIIQFSHTTTM